VKFSPIRSTLTFALATALACAPAGAEDIDLFTSPGGSQHNPNVVIFIDNSANWNSNAQHWPSVKQGQAELRALRQVVSEVADNVLNLGLMLFTPGQGSSPDGAYVRFHVRPMNGTNKAALRELIGSDVPACVDGPNSLNATPNCIFKNFSGTTEQVGTAKADYSAGLYEVFKYFGGYTDPANAHTDIAGTPVDVSHFGTQRYARNGIGPDPNADLGAFADGASATRYTSPLNPDGSNACAKNFLVFIGNGYPNQDAPATLLTGVNGSATQLLVQSYNSTITTTTTTLGVDASCTSPATCATNAPGGFPGYDSYACTGGTPQAPVTNIGTDGVCESNAACVTRASTTAPGHISYSCSGGTSTPIGSATGTDKACESQAACSARTATILPGYTSYGACSGGTSNGTVAVTQADAVTESRAACVARAQALFPGYTTYTCTGGTAGTAAPTGLGNSGLVCETVAACGTRMATANPGHDTVACTVGSAGPFTVGTDAVCENVTQCKNAISFPVGSALTTPVCTGGTSCASGGKLLNQTMQGSCAAGAKAQYTVTATDTPYTGQTMTATGCAAGKLSGQTFTGFNTCLSGQTMSATDSCVQNQNITGTKTVTTITGVGPPAAVGRNADEWAKYLYTTDVNALAGQQNVTTYTIDVFKDQQDASETALLQSMAKYGGGRYFKASDENAILNALRQILVEIQAVNSVFASASLPINATNRSQNENQVFIGMFRPDSTALPRWYGNLKHYQVALFGADAKLADANGAEAIAATTGFVQACATSFYTKDSGVNTWAFSPSSAGTCTSVANSTFNDLPDGGVVEKGAAAEVLRRGNSTTATAPFTVSRTMKTCATSPCPGLIDFNATNVTMARTGASTVAENANIVDFTLGKDVFDENGNANLTEPRMSIHGDIAHSRPLPVNFGGGRGVEVFYGSNDGALHGMKGADGTELWSFIAPEHHARLKRLTDNTPLIAYPSASGPPPGSTRKDYFFDGSAGLYQNADSSKVWIYPTMRRGGRMMYAFDVSASGAPVFKWVNGCPSLITDTGCTTGMDGIGQTWSVPAVAFIKGYNAGADPVIIMGGGYDACEDSDAAATTCTASAKGNHVYVINADTGVVIKSFDTLRAVPADVTLIDHDFDGMVDHGYVADTGGNLYRIDFSSTSCSPFCAALGSGAWTITRIANTTGSNRKFVFGPSALYGGNKVFLALGSGDRERPLIGNYPYTTPVTNRFYMFIDKFPASGTVSLDGGTMTNFTADTSCTTTLAAAQDGWFMDLTAGTGEQTVTSSVIFGGTVFFSTNRPVPTPVNSCATNLGEARGYAVNLLNASGVIGTGALCGGSRSGTFTGGGLPPSPVVGTVPVLQADGTTKPISVLIGGIGLDTGTGSPISAQQPPVPIKSIRSRVYWYPRGDK
jgi:Tfp pilus tip-associated adhesin PilY1